MNVFAKDVRVELAGGGSVMARKLGRSRMNDCGLAAGWREGETATEEKRIELLCRAAIVGAEGVKREDGSPLRFALARHSQLGLIAPAEVYDALDTEAVVRVLGIAMGGEAEPAGEDRGEGRGEEKGVKAAGS
jgi:hypothetical protein